MKSLFYKFIFAICLIGFVTSGVKMVLVGLEFAEFKTWTEGLLTGIEFLFFVVAGSYFCERCDRL